MEEDIQNYSPTVMFRGTPCMIKKRNSVNIYGFMHLTLVRNAQECTMIARISLAFETSFRVMETIHYKL